MAGSEGSPSLIGRIPELDGVRGLAIALVLVGHLFNPLMPEGGGFGVSLFFALSGYLITTILIKELRTTGRISLRAFYLRRARRLLPALTVFLAAFAVWAAFAGWPAERILHSTLPVFFYSANWAGAVGWGVGHHMDHTWSLSVEEQFYIAWPLLMIFIARLRFSWLAAIGLAVLVVLSRYAVVYGIGLDADPVYTLLRYDEIMLGCALALAGYRFPSWAGHVALGVLLVLATQSGVRLAADHLGYVFIAIVTTVIVGAAHHLRWLLDNVPLRHLGRISYSVYLWHFPIWVITANPWLTLGATLLLAEISWYLIEQPILSGRRLPWLTPRDGSTPPTAAGRSHPAAAVQT
jgi:peptidoglycan/LPS O-acetylase OafA/YrhL